jgi:hypothetical protein
MRGTMKGAVSRSSAVCVSLVTLFVVLMTTSSALASPLSGHVVYSANFSTPVPKWRQSGASLMFENKAYVIRSTNQGQLLVGGPNLVRPQASVTLRASLDAGASARSGFGVYCLADYRSAGFGISFLVQRDGGWTIWEQLGKQPIQMLASGEVRNLDVVHETSVTAICYAEPNSRDMKLGLYVNGRKISLLTELSPKIAKPWLLDIDVFSDNSTPTIVRAKSFVLRSLAG